MTYYQQGFQIIKHRMTILNIFVFSFPFNALNFISYPLQNIFVYSASMHFLNNITEIVMFQIKTKNGGGF